MLSVEFEVEGRPVPQGSMTASYNRRTQTAHVHHVQGAALAMWRASIRNAAHSAMQASSPTHRAVEVGLVFWMPRPASHSAIRNGVVRVRERYRSAQVTTTPDIDKLIRAVLDALTGIVYLDDSQVIKLAAQEMYALQPGLSVQAREYEWAKDAERMEENSRLHNMEGQGSLLYLWEKRGG